MLLFADEATFYRQPTQAWLWSSWGRKQPRLPWSHRDNTRLRVVGYLNATSGAVHTQSMSIVTAKRLAANVAQLSRWYPQAESIYLAWDNWPNHRHPLVQNALGQQPRVHVLWLPTYAPWLNPIEKLWRRTRQRVTHAHPWSDNFQEFRAQLQTEFESQAHGSPELIRYVGLET